MPRPPGFKLSEEWIARAKEIFCLTGLSQEKLAENMGEKYKGCTLDRQIVSKFLNGIPIGRQNFVWLCQELQLNVKEVVAPLTDSRPETKQEQTSVDYERITVRKTVDEDEVEGDRICINQSNPFSDNGKITNPARFFDHEPSLRQLFEELSKGCNISLVGEPEIGKSSLLYMIYLLGKEHLKPCPDGFIYLDLQNIHDENYLFEEICYEVGVPLERKDRLARELRGKRFILCLDEIQVLTDEECFPPRVRSKLRGLSDGGDAPFKLVAASRSPFSQLFPHSDKRSPLDIPPTRVLPFSRKEAEEFLKSRLKPTGIKFSPDEIDTIINLSEGHPAKLQRAAAELFDQYRGMK